MKQKEINETIQKIKLNPKYRKEIFNNFDSKTKSFILFRLNTNIRTNLINSQSCDEVVKILQHLDPDDATQLIRLLSSKQQKLAIKGLEKKLQESVKFLMKFDPKTAAGLMNLNYIQIDIQAKISEVIEKFREHEANTGKAPEILLMDSGKLIGYLPGYQLGIAHSTEAASKYRHRISKVAFNSPQTKVIEIFKNHPHTKIAVLGDDGNIVGIIYSDDILRLLSDNKKSDLYAFAGVREEENIFDSTKNKIQHRYKWLIINLATAFLASFTVHMFDETIAKYVLLAVYMPIVAGMGGNAATQTLAVMVRSISQNEINFKNMLPALKTELGAALINGILNALIVATIVLLFNRNLPIAIILGIAMIINLQVASFFGLIIPMLMQKFGKDPATSATIFITTATDVLGFLTFLGLASVLLN